MLPGHDPDETSDGFPTPMVISGDAEGSSQFSTERISSRPMATHPQWDCHRSRGEIQHPSRDALRVYRDVDGVVVDGAGVVEVFRD